MSHQLIHTVTNCRQGVATPRSEALARSEGFPPELEKYFAKTAERFVNGASGLRGAKYMYDGKSVGNERLHVFSCSTLTGEGEKATNIVHHIAMTDEEAHRATSDEIPLTPAGMALALELHHVWVHSASEIAGIGSVIPPLRLPLQCPSTDGQPTWYIFTGKSENAGILADPVYARGVLLLMPDGTNTRDVLRLMHESDALAPTHGWGIRYCTSASEREINDTERRLFCAGGTAFHLLTKHTPLPVLEIKPGLQETKPPIPSGPVQEEADKQQKPQEEAVPAAEETAALLSALPAPPCTYKEYSSDDLIEPDADDELPERGRGMLFYLMLSGIVIIGLLVLAMWLWSEDGEPEDAVGELPGLRLPDNSARPADVENRPEPKEPAHVVEKPRPAPQPTAPRPPRSEPMDEEPEVDSTTVGSSREETSGSKLGELSPFLVGNQLPDGFLPEQETEISQGTYILWYRDNSSDAGTPQQRRVLLKPGEATLKLGKKTDGVYRLTLLRSGKRAADCPEVLLNVQRGKLRECSVEGQEAAVRIPFCTAEGKLDTVLLIPKICIQLRPTQRASLPRPADELRTAQPETYLTASRNEIRVDMRGKGEEWAKQIGEQPIRLEPGHSFYLPQLGEMNQVADIPVREGSRCRPHLRVKNTANSTSTEVGCVVDEMFDGRAAVRTALTKYANTPRQKGTEESTVAHLYYVLTEMAAARDKSRRDRLIDYYASLFRAEQYGNFLREQVLKGCEELMPTPRDIRENRDSAHAAAPELHTKLGKRENVRVLLGALQEKFDEVVREAYHAQREQFIASPLPSLDLILTKVSVRKKGELIWYFKPRFPSS